MNNGLGSNPLAGGFELSTPSPSLDIRTLKTGGSSDLTYSTLDLKHGGIVTVETDGTYDFGTPPLGVNTFSILGSEVRENDVLNTYWHTVSEGEEYGSRSASGNSYSPVVANAPFRNMVGLRRANVAPDPSIDRCLSFSALDSQCPEGGEPGVCLWPSVYETGGERVGPVGKEIYYSSKMWMSTYIGNTARCSYTSLTGSFDTGNNNLEGMFDEGEAVNVLSGLGTSWTARISFVDTAKQEVYFAIDPGITSLGSDHFDGMVMTSPDGNSAITTAITPMYKSWGSMKNARFWDIVDTVEAEKNIHVSYASSLALILIGYFDGSVERAREPSQQENGLNVPKVRDWTRTTMWMNLNDQGGGFGELGVTIDGVTRLLVDIDLSYSNPAHGPVLANWGMECNTKNGLSGYLSSLVSQTDVFSVVISSSPTWGEVNHLEAEPQLMLNRSSTSLQFRVNEGVHSTLKGKYVYLLKTPVTPINTTGLQL